MGEKAGSLKELRNLGELILGRGFLLGSVARANEQLGGQEPDQNSGNESLNIRGVPNDSATKGKSTLDFLHN